MAIEATPARARALASVRDSEAFRAACGRPGRPAWRCSSWRSSPRSRSVLRAAASRGRTRASSTRRRSPTRSRDPLLAPLARWDAVWYLAIADSGYGGSDARAAFFPLYPLLVRGVARCSAARRGAAGRARTLVSLARVPRRRSRCCTGWRRSSWAGALARARAAAARVFPAALYFGAPYSESLFLLLSVGAFYAARTGRWAWAGACAAARLGHAQRGPRAACCRWSSSGGHARRGGGATRAWLAARAARARRVRRLARARGGRRARASSTCRRRGRAQLRRARSAGAWDGARGRVRRRAPARVGLARARSYFEQAARRPVPDRAPST